MDMATKTRYRCPRVEEGQLCGRVAQYEVQHKDQREPVYYCAPCASAVVREQPGKSILVAWLGNKVPA